ncbi:unnamed protein product, partial [Pylaiella littoralis]
VGGGGVAFVVAAAVAAAAAAAAHLASSSTEQSFITNTPVYGRHIWPSKGKVCSNVNQHLGGRCPLFEDVLPLLMEKKIACFGDVPNAAKCCSLFFFFRRRFAGSKGPNVHTAAAVEGRRRHQNMTVTFSLTTPPVKVKPFWLSPLFTTPRQQDVELAVGFFDRPREASLLGQ